MVNRTHQTEKKRDSPNTQTSQTPNKSSEAHATVAINYYRMKVVIPDVQFSDSRPTLLRIAFRASDDNKQQTRTSNQSPKPEQNEHQRKSQTKGRNAKRKTCTHKTTHSHKQNQRHTSSTYYRKDAGLRKGRGLRTGRSLRTRVRKKSGFQMI